MIVNLTDAIWRANYCRLHNTIIIHTLGAISTEIVKTAIQSVLGASIAAGCIRIISAYLYMDIHLDNTILSPIGTACFLRKITWNISVQRLRINVGFSGGDGGGNAAEYPFLDDFQMFSIYSMYSRAHYNTYFFE